MRWISVLAVWALLALVSVPCGAQTSTTTESNSLALRPGDVIRIEVWREKDLSGDFLVDANGMVILPMVGEQQVAGVPIPELRRTLLEKYRVELRNPSIIITPMRRISVLGEVQKPGLYPVDPTVTVADAVALAGGATSAGDLNRIVVVRAGQTIRERVGVADTPASANIRSDDQIIVGERSWFRRNSTFVVSTILSLTSIAIALVRS